MDKSPDAFRTISEVADHLDTPAHVLRFWESRFPQIRPVKRAGGRRYYRPNDVALLTGIKRLLHDEGMTIRGVQKILREQGVRHVAALSGVDHSEEIELDAEAALEVALASFAPPAPPMAPPEAETAQVVALETALRRAPAPEAKTEPADILPLFAAAAERPVAALPASRVVAEDARGSASGSAPPPVRDESHPEAGLTRPADLRALLANISADTLRSHTPALSALALRLAALADRMAAPPRPSEF